MSDWPRHSQFLTTQSDLWCLPAAFFCGIATASLLHENVRPRMLENTMSLIALAALALLFAFAKTHAGVAQIALTGIAFYMVACGADLFGLLRLKSAQRLGHVSYGVYLLQGIPITLLFWNTPFRALAVASPMRYWLALLVCAALLCIVAALTFALIERPFIQLGKSIQSPASWFKAGASRADIR